MLAKFLALASLAAVSLAHNTHNTRKTCEVPAKGAGQDDGPTINSVFKKCSHNSKIVLDKYYVVDTLLLTQNLDNVEIELSGTGELDQAFFKINVAHVFACSQFNTHRTSPNGLLRVCTSPTRMRMFLPAL